MRRLLNTLYVTNSNAYLRKKDDAIGVFVDDAEVMSVPFHLLEGVVLFGHVGCSMALAGACAERGVSVSILGETGRFLARVEGPVTGNVLLRREQYRVSTTADASVKLAKRFVVAKVHNSRIVLQHFARDYPEYRGKGLDDAILALRASADDARSATSLDELRGIEGNAAHVYFSVFDLLLRTGGGEALFAGRTRRPPKDPVNATLSFFYSILGREIASGCETVGLDPQMGFLHACRPGRASLALDIIEELRAPIVDRFVLSLFNRKQLQQSDFQYEGKGCSFKDATLKKVISLWQEKKREKVTHPFLCERVEFGLLPFVQAQLLARYLRGDLDDYPALLWR